MSLKNLKKIFVVCFLAGACTLLNARATLPFLDEWAKSLDYSNEKAKYVDLTWGAVAIETGFIHNLRFFGDYQIEVEKGKRIYAKDKSKDPLFAIIRELFPSTGGVLSINGGGAVPKLCNELSCTDIGKIINYCFLSANCNLFSSGQDKKPKNKEKWINDCLEETRIVNENKDPELKTSKRKLLGNIYTILNEASTKKASNMQKHKKEVLAQVLLAFLYEKINLQGLKIKDTTAIYKKAIIAHEKNVPLIETVGGLKVAFGEEMFLETIHQKEEETEDNKAAKAARKYFNDLWQDNPFPYIATPIQDGPAYVVKQDGILNENYTFSDCVEVAIRHFFNIILYAGWESGTFNYQNLDIANGKSDFFKDFYTKQHNRDLANNSSINLRTDWNKVMCNIPEVIYRMKNDGKRIADIKQMKPYQPKEEIPGNEIKAGIINLYNVLAYLLGESQIPTDKKDVADSKDTMTRYELIKEFYESKGDSKGKLSKVLAEKFKTLLTKFDHEQSYEVSIDFHSDNESNAEPDLYGNVEIFKNDKQLLILEMQNGHGLLKLTKKTTNDDQEIDIWRFIDKNPTVLLLKKLSLLKGILSRPDSKSWNVKENLNYYESNYPYYFSFHGPSILNPEETSEGNIRSFLETVKNDQLISESIKKYYRAFFCRKLEIKQNGFISEYPELTLENILKDDIYRKCVTQINIHANYNNILAKNLDNFVNLQELIIGANNTENISINNLPQLKNIDIKKEVELTSFTIKNCAKLEKLALFGIAGKLNKIHIEDCQNLQDLKLLRANKTAKITIKNCPMLVKERLKKDYKQHNISFIDQEESE